MQLTEHFSLHAAGQELVQLGELALSLVLSSLIGLEREVRMKSAGIRTHALVGVASALMMLVSKYGFGNVLQHSVVVLDPSRIAAQIVSGIGFIGGGLIFVQRDVVRGLTTAAIIWLTAGIGMACGAGLPILALFVTATHFLVVYAYSPLVNKLLAAQAECEIRYVPGKGAVDKIMQLCTGRGFSIREIAVENEKLDGELPVSKLNIQLRGRTAIAGLLVSLGDIKGVISARIADADSQH